MNSKEPPWRHSSPNWLYYYVIRGDKQMVHSVTCQVFFFFFKVPVYLQNFSFPVKQIILLLKPFVTSSCDVASHDTFFIENIKTSWKRQNENKGLILFSGCPIKVHVHTHTHTNTHTHTHFISLVNAMLCEKQFSSLKSVISFFSPQPSGDP